MTIGEKIASLRKKENLTQEQLAEILGVSRQAISRWESDLAYPETEKLIKLSSLFHCTVDQLLKEDEAISEKPKKRDLRRLYPVIYAFGLFVLSMIFYAIDYASGSFTIMGTTYYIDANFYQIIGSNNYQIGNMFALMGFLLMLADVIFGMVLGFIKVTVKHVKIRRYVAIATAASYLLTLLSVASSMQVGAIFVLLLSIGHIVMLYTVKWLQYAWFQVSDPIYF